MASPQDFARALRERFGLEETIITLIEILSFLNSHQKQPAKAGKQKQKQHNHGTQQNATPETRLREETRKPRATITTIATTATATERQEKGPAPKPRKAPNQKESQPTNLTGYPTSQPTN